SNTVGGNVTLIGELTNPVGDTTITSAGGNITTGAEAEFYTGNAFLSAGGSIGTDESDRFSLNLVNVENGDRPAIQQASGDGGVYLDVSTLSLNSELTGMNIGLYNLESGNGDVDLQINDAELYTLSNYNATDDSFDTDITLVNLDVELGAANVAGDLIVNAGADDTVTTNVNIVDTLTAEGTTFLTVQDAIQASAGTELAGGGAVLNADTIEALDTELDNLEATAANSDVTVTNTGKLAVGQLSDLEGISASGDVNVTASDLELYENVTAGGSLALTVIDENQGDNDLYIYGAAITAGDDVTLSVGNTLVQNSSSVITAGGELAIEIDNGDQVDIHGGTVNLLGEVNATAASVTANNDSDVVLLRSASTNVGWTVQGAAGFADVLYGSVLDDVISSTDGDDVLDGQAGDDSLSGNDGDDALRGDAGLDTLDGGAGNDSLNGGADDDSLIGGADDDTLNGGAGSDSLEGGTGNDTADYSTSAAAVTIDISTSSSTGVGGDAEGDTLSGFENITGSDFADSLTGSDEDNELDGNLGDDTIVAGLGNDLLIGDSGDDSLVGGLGNDTLIGGGDSDTLIGVDSTAIAPGQGEIDHLYGQTGSGNVFVLGADGTVYYDDGNDAANGQEDYALIYGFTDDGENTIRLASGFTYYLAEIADGSFASLTGLYVETNGISGFGETDELIAVVTSDAPDLPLEILVTGTGDFDYMGDSSQVALAAEEGVITDPVYDNEVTGSTANDYLRGTAYNDSISGEEGNDRLLGYDGTDFLDGGSGNDRLYGHDGEDTLEGGSGNDLLYGGNDADLLKGGEANDTIIGGSGDDTIIGVDENSSTAGRGEIDFLRGQSGANIFVLGANNQVYYDDGDNTSNGQTDFARIIDFDETEDSIQLASGHTYFLATAPSDIGTGAGYAGVFLDSNGDGVFDSEDELIAVLFGVDAPDVVEEITGLTLGYVFDDED
ncbi:MAG: calcium-binding protein, partial [Cyanobacteria bacterium P01_A01_bin.83]